MIGTILGLARAAFVAVSSIMGYFAQRKIDKRAAALAQVDWLKNEQTIVRKAADARHRTNGDADSLRNDPNRRT
jgi:hypothetical protein